MERWTLGEKRNAYTVISASIGDEPVISSASYEVLDIYNDSIVVSGTAIVHNQILYFLWEPQNSGTYVARINYVVGEESYKSDQVIEVKETM